MPGFSLFRRASSLVAHPTTQGVSLRGLGSTGASRTLVLWDGIPMNDPFGGWVYWTRFAPEDLERIEVSRGASTSLFGDRAMGGAIHLFSRQPEPWRLHGGYEAGNRGTHQVSAGASHLWSNWALSGGARAFTTDGYFNVPDRIRGPVDEPLGVRFVGANARGDYFRTAHRLFTKVDILTEERRNGTPLQRNSTSLGTVAGNYLWSNSAISLSLLGFHTREQFHSGFSAIAADRRSERRTFVQSVPAEAVGGAALVRHASSRWNMLGGADVQRAKGTSTDRLFPAGLRVGGGTQLQHGYFGQTDFRVGALKLFLGGRHQVAGRAGQYFNPSAGFTLGRRSWRARGSVYRAFRAPTLNELYREFAVGNARTLANSNLAPETLFAAEVGFDYVGESTRIGVTAFRNDLSDVIVNVTQSVTGNQIVRQRQNAASALSRGVEVDLRQQWRNFRGEASYLYVDGRFGAGPRVPQIPRHQGNAQLTYSRAGTLLSAGFRSFSRQFEDDLNLFTLAGFSALQIAAQQRVARSLYATLAVENALNREFFVGFSPTPLIGAPRLWRVGLRWDGRIR